MIIFTIILLSVSLIYFSFLLVVLRGIKKSLADKKSVLHTNLPKVSVIIPFRNEASLIERSIKSLSLQNYSKDKYEVIYVNDFSTDGGDVLVRNILPQNFILIDNDYADSNISPKKRAISKAIKIASGDIIVCTDADCYHSENWLNCMVQEFSEKTGFVSGPAIFSSDNSIFQGLQQIEFAGLVLVGMGLIGLKRPLICNGANLAYRKEAFIAVNGYEGNANLTSGDDEFLMQKIAHNSSYEVKFCSTIDSVVVTEPNKTVAQFFRQRQRWASKGFHYDSIFTILLLLAIFSFYLLFFTLPFLGVIVDKKLLVLFSVLFSVKAIIEYLIMSKGNRLLFAKLKCNLFFIGELVQPFYIIFSSVMGTIGGLKWKDREVRR